MSNFLHGHPQLKLDLLHPVMFTVYCTHRVAFYIFIIYVLCTEPWYMYCVLNPNICTVYWTLIYVLFTELWYMYCVLNPDICTVYFRREADLCELDVLHAAQELGDQVQLQSRQFILPGKRIVQFFSSITGFQIRFGTCL